MCGLPARGKVSKLNGNSFVKTLDALKDVYLEEIGSLFALDWNKNKRYEEALRSLKSTFGFLSIKIKLLNYLLTIYFYL